MNREFDKLLKVALSEAMDEEYRWTRAAQEQAPEHKFSEKFEENMEGVLRSAGRRYVCIGRRRIHRAAVIALIAVMVLAMTAGAVAIQRAVVNWNERQNDVQGTLDVTFGVDDPNHLTEEFHYRKPETPEGYEIVREEKHSETSYEIEYHSKDGKIVLYSQHGEVENMGLSLDNEDAEFHEVTVNGCKGYSYSKLGNNALTWVEGNTLYDIGGTCDMETVWQMAKSIK